MGLDHHVLWKPRLELQTIDVLREELQQQALVMKQFDERVRNRRPVLSWKQLLCQCVERQRILPEVAYIKHSLRVREVQAREIRI